jgi:hypothetical protein
MPERKISGNSMRADLKSSMKYRLLSKKNKQYAKNAAQAVADFIKTITLFEIRKRRFASTTYILYLPDNYGNQFFMVR